MNKKEIKSLYVRSLVYLGPYMGPMGQMRLMRLIGLMGDRTGETDATLMLNRVKGLVIINDSNKQE
ncbi:MAG TPA: hypothetical protein PLA12_07280 [Candidatus Hydrogenedens sp.]|nr:hypothetical protein [Candidatus Hydrogenedens sp.]